MSTNQYRNAPGPSDNPVGYTYPNPHPSHAMATWLDEPRKDAPYDNIASVSVSQSSRYVLAGHYSTSNAGATHGADAPPGPRAASWVNQYVFLSHVAPSRPQLTDAEDTGSSQNLQPRPFHDQAASLFRCWAKHLTFQKGRGDMVEAGSKLGIKCC